MFETSFVDGRRTRAKGLPESFFLTVLGVTSVSLVGAILAMVAAHNDREVASRQQTTTGTIVAHEPANHNRYGFRFHVGSHEYQGWETPQHAEPILGQSTTVYYDPLNPKENSLTDFVVLADDNQGMAIGLMFLWIIISSAAFVAERLLRKRTVPQL